MNRQKLLITWTLSSHECAVLHFALWQREKVQREKLAALPKEATQALRSMLEQNATEARNLLAGLENARRHYVQEEEI